MKFKLTRLLSLNIVLTIPFVMQLVGVGGGVSWLADHSAHLLVDNLTLSLLEDIGDRLQTEIDHFLAKPIAITEEHQNLIDLGILNLNNLEPWGPYLYKQYLNYRHDFLTGFLISNQINEFRAAGQTYTKQGKRVQGLARAGKKTQYRYYGYTSIDDYRQERNKRLMVDYFKATQRPWYSKAAKTRKIQWTPLFTPKINQKNLVINFSRPLYNADRTQLLGVTSIQLDIAYLNQFLQSLKIGRTGSAFIVDQNGYLIANSNGQNQVKVINGKAVPLLSNQSSNPIIQKISSDLINFPKFQKQYFSTFFINKQSYFVLTLPIQQNNGLQWLAVIVIPQADLLSEIWQNQRLTFLLSSLALLMAIIIGLISAYYITQPIISLSRATLDLAGGSWQQSLKISPVTELKNLAQAFNQMASQLQNYVKKLQTQEQQLRQFLEAIPIGVTVYDSQKKQIFINNQGIKFLEMNIPSMQRNIQLTLQGQSFHINDLVTNVNKKNIAIEIWAKPIYDEVNNIVFAIFIFEDITKRKQAERLLKNYNQSLIQEVKQQTIELADAKEKAESANRAKSLLLTNMSHELKTPLHAILGFTHLVINDLDFPKKLIPSLNIVQTNGRHLFLLITNILDLAKIEAGQLSLQPQSVNFIDFIEEIQQIFQLSAQTKNLDFEIRYLTPCPPVIRVDTTKLRQILFNLLSNAFKFTTLGSVSVAITCEIFDRENAILIFHIEDTGTGITELDKASIFQAFYRGNSPNSLIDGTGLGLNLTQQYVQLLGGEIMLESEVQQGTCIYFYLPVKILETETQFDFTLSSMQSIKPEKSNQRIPLVFEDIKNLSPQWCQVFYEALTNLDDRKMLALLVEIQPQYPELAQSLEKLINAVEIQLLINLFASFSLEDNREF